MAMDSACVRMDAVSDSMSPTLAFEAWQQAGSPAGEAVRLKGDQDYSEDEYRSLLTASSIVIDFPSFVDGRGFSHARILRDRGFSGELLAAGELLPDQWQYLERVGFSGLEDAEAVREAAGLQRFSDVYQADTLQPLPRFRR